MKRQASLSSNRGLRPDPWRRGSEREVDDFGVMAAARGLQTVRS